MESFWERGFLDKEKEVGRYPLFSSPKRDAQRCLLEVDK